MMKLNKKICIVILIICLPLMGGNFQVYAWSGSIPFANTGGSSGSDEGDDGFIEKELSIKDDGDTYKKYTCQYKYNISTVKNVTIDAYDYINEKELLNSTKLEILSTNRILAGTYLGLKITEISSVNWKLDVNVKVEIYRKSYTTASKVCTCKYTNKKEIKEEILPISASVSPAALSCSNFNGTYNNSCPSKFGCDVLSSCSWKYDIVSEKLVSSNNLNSGDEFNQCKQMANEAASKEASGYLYSSYVLNLKDSNDAMSKETTKIMPTGHNELSGIVGMEGKTYKSKYEYSPSKVCMDVKIAKVRYVGKGIKCDSENEIEISKRNDYWAYFVPLNYKSDSYFSFSLSPNNKITKEQCKTVMNNYSDYYEDLIIKIDGTEFSKNKKDDLKQIEKDNGCYLSSRVNIPVTQKFYNEVKSDGKIMFEGFNFYYKPIDITNPFPNGLTTSSLWYDKFKNNDIDFTNSYDSITYVAENIDLTKIREYNKDNEYTSWNNMTLNGKSLFVDKNIKRLQSVNLYKLGCGPINSKEKLDNGKVNPLYMERCKQ